jgi:hypothetical protein
VKITQIDSGLLLELVIISVDNPNLTQINWLNKSKQTSIQNPGYKILRRRSNDFSRIIISDGGRCCGSCRYRNWNFRTAHRFSPRRSRIRSLDVGTFRRAILTSWDWHSFGELSLRLHSGPVEKNETEISHFKLRVSVTFCSKYSRMVDIFLSHSLSNVLPNLFTNVLADLLSNFRPNFSYNFTNNVE